MAGGVSELVDDLKAIVDETRQASLEQIEARYEALGAYGDLMLEVCEAAARASGRGEGETANDLVAVLDQAHLRLKTLTSR